MKKVTTYLIAMFVAMALFTACGGDNTDTNNQKTDADTAAKTSNDASAMDVTPAKTETNTVKSDTANTASDSTHQTDTTQGKFVEGTFQEIEQGDLFHFIVKDAQGKSHDFWVMKPDATYETISADQAKYKGKKIKVFYKKSKKFIENAGGEVEFEEYVKAELK